MRVIKHTTFQIILSLIYLISLSECVVMNVPMMTDDIDVENTNKISVKVQGNNAESKKTFQVLKVNHFLDDFPSNSKLAYLGTNIPLYTMMS